MKATFSERVKTILAHHVVQMLRCTEDQGQEEQESIDENIP
jgi:hypothetical protein